MRLVRHLISARLAAKRALLSPPFFFLPLSFPISSPPKPPLFPPFFHFWYFPMTSPSSSNPLSTSPVCWILIFLCESSFLRSALPLSPFQGCPTCIACTCALKDDSAHNFSLSRPRAGSLFGWATKSGQSKQFNYGGYSRGLSKYKSMVYSIRYNYIAHR